MPTGERGSLLAVHLIDLRAHYEAELRALTNAQRHVEEIRTTKSDEQRQKAFARLFEQFVELRKFNDEIDKGLDDIDREAHELQSGATYLGDSPGSPAR